MNTYIVTYAIGSSRHNVQNRLAKVQASSASVAASIVNSRLPAQIRQFGGTGVKAEVINVKRDGSLFE